MEDYDQGQVWSGGLNWVLRKFSGTYGVDLWKFITTGWESFVSHITFKVGDRSSIFFGITISASNGVPLRDHFPSLYALVEDKDARVSDYLEHISSSVV